MSEEFKFTNTWFVRNIDISMKILQNLFKDKPVKILEIGSHEGRSAIWMLNNLCCLEGSSLTSIDSYKVDDTTSPVETYTYKLFQHNMSLCKERKKFDQHIGYSKDILPKLVEQNKIYDIIYVDGSHLMDDVFTDMTYSNQMLRKGGIMLLDDVGFNQNSVQSVMGAIKKFLAEYPDLYTVILKEWQWMLKKN